jgi:hypothetical protein
VSYFTRASPKEEEEEEEEEKVLGKFVHFLCVSFVAGWIVGRVEVE